MSYFAERLKNLRTESGKSMQELADEAKVSKSMICKIERDEVQPTIDVAGRLAKALGKTLSEMLHVTQTTQVVHTTKEEQAAWKDAQNIVRRNISPVFAGLKIEWLHVEMPGKTEIPKSITLTPGTEKFVLLMKGALDIKVDQTIYKLKKGDSFYFEASAPHDFINSSKEMAEFYIVIKHG